MMWPSWSPRDVRDLGGVRAIYKHGRFVGAAHPPARWQPWSTSRVTKRCGCFIAVWMPDTLTTALKWFASGSGIIAAGMVSLDLGRRLTGWGFVLFVFSSVAWIGGSVLTKDFALGTQNIALFAINLFGVYRYLVRKKPNG